MGELMNLVGEEKVKDLVQRTTAAASYNPDYAATPENIWKNWCVLCVFIGVFALFSTIALKRIDKDKR